MPLKKVFRENWLTLPLKRRPLGPTFILVAFLVLGMRFELPASPELVFTQGEYWRAWTTLFVHADAGHLVSNLVLFIPFAYILYGYFGPAFFPVLGFLIGGIVNLFVLLTLPEKTFLVGVSGVAYWMGAAWITLAFLIDRREKKVIRIVKSLGVSMLLFLPDTFRPEVSYLTHFLGYVAGVCSALVFYRLNHKKFVRAERFDLTYDFDAHWDPEENRYSETFPNALLEKKKPEVAS